MYDEKRRRRRYREKKPVSNETVLAVGLAGATLLVFVFFLAVSIRTDGNTSNLLGGLSVFSLIGAAVALATGVKARKNENFNKVMRALGVAVPAAAVAVWGGLYLIGMFFG